MGLALSPVLARIYLDVKHDALWKRPLRAFPQLPTVRFFRQKTAGWLAGKLHVDDGLFWSRRACWSCIAQTIAQVWPEDVGFSLESSTRQTDFLHCVVTFNASGGSRGVALEPRTPNAAFARGDTAVPEVAGLGPFLLGMSRPQHLHRVLVPKLWLLAGAFSAAGAMARARPVILLLVEVLRLGWPAKWVINIGMSFSNHRDRKFTSICTLVCIWLRRYRHLVPRLGGHTLQNDHACGWGIFCDTWEDYIIGAASRPKQ
jgi:hypothetical protein